MNDKPWKQIGKSRANPSGDGRIAFFDVPDFNLVAYLCVPNGGADNEVDIILKGILDAVNDKRKEF